MVCHCSVPGSSPQPDTKVFHPATPTHPAKAMTPAQRRQLALEALAGTETVSRAGQHAVRELPGNSIPTRSASEGQRLLTFLENRAYAAIGVTAALERKKARLEWRGRRTQAVAVKLGHAQREESRAVALATDAATLLKWLREDVLSLAGPDHATRRELFDFLVAELRLREPLCPHRIGPVVRALANQRDDLLAFAAQLDRDLAIVAAAEVARQTVRASSLVENLNSRLRNYFFLRRQPHPGTAQSPRLLPKNGQN
ncbi:MAG: hypothetical protein ABIK89_10205 [Planctomycetota bacterium]